MLAALKLTVEPVTRPPLPVRVKVVSVIPDIGSLNVAVMMLFAGTLTALFAGIVDVTVGGTLSMAPERFTMTGGMFAGAVTAKLTSADLGPFTLVAAGSVKITPKVQVLFAGRFAPEQASAVREKSAALAPVTAPAPSVAGLTALGFVIVTIVGEDTAPAFWAGNVTVEGAAVSPMSWPTRRVSDVVVPVLLSGSVTVMLLALP
jgi:hypothetical protein